MYGRFMKEEENKKKAIELGTEPEPVEWDMKVVITPMTVYRDADVLAWMGAREILFVVNYKNLHWFTFSGRHRGVDHYRPRLPEGPRVDDG